MKYKNILSVALSTAFLAACGGGGGGGVSVNQALTQGTAGNTQLAAGALDGQWACVGGPLTIMQLIKGNYTDNQILQGTYTTNITFSGLNYFAYAGATASTLEYNIGITKGPLTAPYYYGKTTMGDRLIYERYLPVLSKSPKIGVATIAGEVSNASGTEFSLDGNGKLLISYYSPTALPVGLTYSSASGGPGEIQIKSTTCNKLGGDSAPVVAGFATSDFSGKSNYYVGATAYSLGTFNADGSALASNMITSGTPVLNPTAATWSVANGDLLITFQGLTQRYTLISNDTVNRYYKVKKTSDNGTISTIGFFYDQTTGLAQAQNFVATHQVP